jgi:hypothetical protein
MKVQCSVKSIPVEGAVRGSRRRQVRIYKNVLDWSGGRYGTESDSFQEWCLLSGWGLQNTQGHPLKTVPRRAQIHRS